MVVYIKSPKQILILGKVNTLWSCINNEGLDILLRKAKKMKNKVGVQWRFKEEDKNRTSKFHLEPKFKTQRSFLLSIAPAGIIPAKQAEN